MESLVKRFRLYKHAGAVMIFEREISVSSGAQTKRVILRIGPVEKTMDGDFVCSVEIPLVEPAVRRIAGADALQAWWLGLRFAHSSIGTANASDLVRAWWEEKDDNCGF
jgi:hypothetical protein